MDNKIYVVNHEVKQYIEIDTNGPLLCGEVASLLSLFVSLMLKGWYYDANDFDKGWNSKKTHNNKVVVTSQIDPSYKLIEWNDIFECDEPVTNTNKASIIPYGDYVVRESSDFDWSDRD